MKTRELIEALQKLNPEAEVVINIKQSNKAYGRQFTISNEIHHGNYSWVNSNYSGACITIHLPDGAYLAKIKD